MDELLRALKFRAWHRGTREADLMIGGFFDAHHAVWDPEERVLFAALLAEQDVDIMAWAIGSAEVPALYAPLVSAMRALDYIKVAK